MIGLDANELVRYIMQDDPKQSPKAGKLIDALDDANQGFIALVSVVEIVWMLSSCYGLNRAQIAQALDVMLRSKSIAVEQSEQVWRALRAFTSSKADFADCLIERSAAQAGCEKTMTFDVGEAKHAGMKLIA